MACLVGMAGVPPVVMVKHDKVKQGQGKMRARSEGGERQGTRSGQGQRVRWGQDEG